MSTSSNRTFFKRLRANGNAFGMLITEPMFGIPFNLYTPYFSLYMAQLGCSPKQIGLLTSVGILGQFFFTLIASPIIDRFGRRYTTLVMDVLSWSVAVLLWLFAQSFVWFLVAAIVQAANRIVFVSWTCLMVEDTEKDLLVPIFSWITVAGLLSGFFSPVAAVFVAKYQVVPTMRVLFAISFVLFTAMFFIRNALVKETSVGRARMELSRREPVFRQFHGLWLTVGEVWRNPGTRFMFILTAVYNMAITVRAPFFALLLSDAFGFADSAVGYFAMGTSVIMLAVYLFVQPRLTNILPKLPLSVGMVLLVAGSMVLVPVFPGRSMALAMVLLSVVLTSVGSAVAQPFIDGLGHGSMNNDNRSHMTSILYMMTLLASAIFGFLGGVWYEKSAALPFLAAAALYGVCVVLLAVHFRRRPAQQGDGVNEHR